MKDTKSKNWQLLLAVILILISALIYSVHYLIFHDAHHIFIYFVGDVAFIPIEVLLVTVVIHKLLTLREQKEKLNKLNMVIGIFFSEVGTELISFFSSLDPNVGRIKDDLQIAGSWSDEDFNQTSIQLINHEYFIRANKTDLIKLKTYLTENRGFLLGLLENPNLLEHEKFTDLLWTVFHVTEELYYRKKINNCSAFDIEHIEGDIKRAYSVLVLEWLKYLKHLKTNYPYLFSLAVRRNPFNEKSSIEIK